MKNIRSGSAPTVEQLWQGSLLSFMVHALMNTRYPALSYEQSWDGLNYSIQNSQGGRGTIRFQDRKIVGAFADKKKVHGMPTQLLVIQRVI